jgi:ABC-type Mn2+/Zn2+ transport system ATPase subunit
MRRLSPEGRRLTLSAPRPSAAGPRASSAVDLVGVTTGYRNRVALSDLTLTVPTGSMVAVVGPNGSGKSTLLKLLLGLVEPWQGTVSLLGRSPAAARRRVGYVPQTNAGDWRFPATVGEVVMMGRCRRIGLFRRPGRTDREAVLDALWRIGMAGRADDQVGELSGGQQQRVFLARALVQQPELLLMDEPLAGVDALTEHDIYELLSALTRGGVTAVLTTHNLSTVREHFDLAVFLNGRVVACGPPSEIFTEENLRAAYGPRMALVTIDGRFYAVDVGGHGG